MGIQVNAVTAPIRLNPDLPGELERIINKAMDKDRKLRYQAASDIRIDLQRLKRDSDSGKSAITAAAAPGHPLRSRRRLLFAELAIVLPILISTAVYLYLRSGGEAIDSIAVLPFVNVSGDPEIEHLSDGITESLIDSLTQLPNLRVVPRSLAFRYKGKGNRSPKVSKELNVRAILTGRVDKFFIKPELMDVERVRNLWSEPYDRKRFNELAVQEDIKRKVAEGLRLRLTDEERKLLTKRYTENNEAYDFYLKGRREWNKRSFEGFEKGIEYFNRAIDKDLFLYKLTVEAIRRVKASPLSKREIIRRLGTSAAQFYRLLDPTNCRKSPGQLITLLYLLDCEIDLVNRTRKTA